MADQGKYVRTMPVPASTARGRVISGAGTLSATLRGVGILYEPSSSTESTGRVQLGGTALGLLGGVVTAGARLKSDAAGALVVATGDATDNSLIMAVALEAGASGELRDVKIL